MKTITRIAQDDAELRVSDRNAKTGALPDNPTALFLT